MSEPAERRAVRLGARRAALCALWALALAAPVRPQPRPEPATWQPLPLFGADVRTLAVSPFDANLVFAGTSAGQVYASRDGGRTWRDAGVPLPFPGWVVGALRFDPNHGADHPRLWVALWGIWGGGHVASSDDLGRTWSSRVGDLPSEQVYVLALAPGEEGRVYAATASGVWGTLDGGKSWRRLTADLPEIGKVSSLLVDPLRPATLFAGTWRQAYRSDDGGTTWRGVFDGMVLDSEVFTLTPVPGKPGEIWASTCGWVYRTLDGGGRWERFQQGLAERRTPSFSTLPDGRLLAGTISGAYVSTDAGATWSLASDPALSVLSIAAPQSAESVLLGTEGAGVWASSLPSSGALGFHPSLQGMTNLRIGALATPGTPGASGDPGAGGSELLVAVNHAGPLSGVYTSRDGGRSFPEFTPLPTVLGLAADEQRAFAATERGLYERKGTDWRRRPDLDEIRIEQVELAGGRAIARTAAAVYELRRDKKGQERFVAVSPPGAPAVHAPRSAALWAEALWLSDETSVVRLDGRADSMKPSAIEAPFAGGRLERSSAGLLYSGTGGTYLKTAPEQPWQRLTGAPTRLLRTGDDRIPALLIAGPSALLLDREGQLRPLDLPFPARDLTAAAIRDGRLLLGTSGYGVQATAAP